MKCTIPEISWHNREPVLSVDINSVFKEFYRVATAGGDNHVLIWQMTISENGAVKQEVISDLTRHQKAVNIVRWSPNGQYLASADDDANMIIWQLKTDNIPLLEGETADRETWIVYKVLRGHKEDIYDLCWSASALKLLSGSIDNTAILWDVSKGKMDHILTDHKGFVQGVAWDPKNQIIATLSTDRICRIFDTSGKHVRARIQKGKLPIGSGHSLHNKEVKFFYDDTFKSFFRRLQFSPDGSLLITPSGHMEGEDCKKALNATLIFTLDNTNEPAVLLPHGRQCSTVVRCCPILFELRQNGPTPLIDLPYRMIIAVGTDHDVILYDTQQRVPFARFQEIHYTRMTDLTWSSDGLLLVASSTDGFCALITFDPKELGVPYVKYDSEDEENPLDISVMEDPIQEKDENINSNNSEKVVKETGSDKKKRSFIEQWVQNPAPKRLKPNPVTPSKGSNNEASKSEGVDVTKKSPKRITPITLSSPTKKTTVIPVKDKTSNNRIDLTIDSPIKQVPEIVVTPKKVLQIPLKDVLLDNVVANVKKVQLSPKRRINPIPVDSEPSTDQTVVKRIQKSSKRITPILIKDKPSNKEIVHKNSGEKLSLSSEKRQTDEKNVSPTSKKVEVATESKKTNTLVHVNEQHSNKDIVEKGGETGKSKQPQKEKNLYELCSSNEKSRKITTPVSEIEKSSQSQKILPPLPVKSPRRIVLTPVKEAVADRKNEDSRNSPKKLKTDNFNQNISPPSEKLEVPNESTKTVSSTLANEPLSNKDIIEKVTEKSSHSEKILPPVSIKSPRRIVPTPVKDKITNSKSGDSKHSPKRIKSVFPNQGPKKLDPKKTSTPPITAFLIKNAGKGSIDTPKKTPTRNEEIKDKEEKVETVDLSNDD